MKHLAVILAAVLIPWIGVAQSTVTGNLVVDGRNRNYRLRIPPAASSGELLPLVVSLHGFALTATSQESSSAMNAVADTAGFFVVYPNGTNVALFLQGWNDDLSGGGVDDVGFIDALLDELIALYPVDPDRIYATGFSNGGGMTVSLACALSGRIKAIAPVAASINPANAAFCSPPVFRPLLQIHGTADLIVPYNGAAATIFYPASAPSEAFFRAWIKQDACSAPVISNLPNTDPFDLSTVTLAALESCSSGNSYRFYRVNGGDHSIPGPGGQNKDLYSSAAIWQFFRSQESFSMRATSAATSSETAAIASQMRQAEQPEIAVQPNPAADFSLVSLSGSEYWNLCVYDLRGQLLYAENVFGQQTMLNTSAMENGMYYLVLRALDASPSDAENLSMQRYPLQVLH